MTSSARRALIAQVRAEEPNCWICGLPIDLTLDPQRHPLASACDELIPRSKGGSPLDRANVRHAHRGPCNGGRGNRPVTPAMRERCRAKVIELMNGSTRRW